MQYIRIVNINKKVIILPKCMWSRESIIFLRLPKHNHCCVSTVFDLPIYIHMQSLPQICVCGREHMRNGRLICLQSSKKQLIKVSKAVSASK